MGYNQTATYGVDALFERKWRAKMTLPFYQKYWNAVSVVAFDDKENETHRHFQKELHVDVAVVTNEKWHMIDDKVVRPPEKIERYSAFCLETKSNAVPGMERDGWMKVSQCTAIVWWFLHRSSGISNAYFLPFKPLQKWFYEGDRYKRYYIKYKYNDEGNKTELRVTPIADIVAAIPGVQRFEVTEDGELLDVERFS